MNTLLKSHLNKTFDIRHNIILTNQVMRDRKTHLNKKIHIYFVHNMFQYTLIALNNYTNNT